MPRPLVNTRLGRFIFPALLAFALPLWTFAQKADPKDTEQWTPVPPIISAPADAPPSDAIVLFDGSSLAQWQSEKEGPCPWKITAAKAMQVAPHSGDIHTQRAFGDIQLHLEWRTPSKVEGHGQERGNSGVFLMGLYELQILDSYDNTTYVNGQAASIYKQSAPLVNASRPPGTWQSYDIIFFAPRFAPDGTVQSPAHMTAFHNGILVQYDFPLLGPTLYVGQPHYKVHAPKRPLELQDHGNPVEFRNIWVRELVRAKAQPRSP